MFVVGVLVPLLWDKSCFIELCVCTRLCVCRLVCVPASPVNSSLASSVVKVHSGKEMSQAQGFTFVVRTECCLHSQSQYELSRQ